MKAESQTVIAPLATPSPTPSNASNGMRTCTLVATVKHFENFEVRPVSIWGNSPVKATANRWQIAQVDERTGERPHAHGQTPPTETPAPEGIGGLPKI